MRVVAAMPVQAADLAVLDDGSAGQLTALGNEALMQGRFDTAIEHQHHRALAADKQSFEALFNHALAYPHIDEGRPFVSTATTVVCDRMPSFIRVQVASGFDDLADQK